ncbi:hypothetical protein [Corynebacterium minutissimum]|uniref:Secreted protein n=1 Tax=Corynebacterium minutissimum TaxID=38301 RepID=A0A2X4RF15_9CORY|nr:hypothetical protein [Corynebacterium minutissimum]KHO30028.1 hypothetical protein NX84_04100 [Corynebacterium minutissimum]QPS60925.1 hypothetical protein I6G51_04765 [Corynebacterium minutissimum]QQA80771.1 hypothetical protein I6H49_08090 [Corynebacterium minutissimum]SQI00631.1 Uncharacterised protein [Corynebacterium minutissimum]VEG05301.1 Uncharacterised protein [Corynebacterium minutissimum]
MNNFSRGLLAATLTGSLALAGTTVASAEEAATSCGSPKSEFTLNVDGKERTFQKYNEFIWTATDDENLKLNRAEIFQIAKEDANVCDSAPIDLGDWGASQDGPKKVDYDIVEGERQDPAPVEDDDKDKDEKPSEDKDGNKDKKSSIEGALSSEDGKPSGLGIAAIVIGVLGALAAIVPNAARALGIKLPF